MTSVFDFLLSRHHKGSARAASVSRQQRSPTQASVNTGALPLTQLCSAAGSGHGVPAGLPVNVLSSLAVMTAGGSQCPMMTKSLPHIQTHLINHIFHTPANSLTHAVDMLSTTSPANSLTHAVNMLSTTSPANSLTHAVNMLFKMCCEKTYNTSTVFYRTRVYQMQPRTMLPSWILKFLQSQLSRRSNCLIVPNFVEIAQTVAEICDFSIFQDGDRRHFGFLNFKFLTVGAVKRVELRHLAKFCRNRSNGGRDMALVRIFKMATAAILDFRNFHFLMVEVVERVELHHCAKFYQNHSNCGWDMAIFLLFKMAAAAILDFQNSKF